MLGEIRLRAAGIPPAWGTNGRVERFWGLARRHRTAALTVLGAFLLGGLAGMVGLSLQPEVHGTVGPGTVSIDPAVRRGETVVELPPLGRVRADSHQGPVRFTVRVDRIDIDRAGQLAGDLARGVDPGLNLRQEIEADLRPLLWSLARQSLVVALIGGIVVGLLLPRRRARYVVASTAGSLSFVVLVGGVAAATFVPTSFDHPKFEGTLAAAPDIVNTVQRHINDVDMVETRLAALSDRLVDLYRSIDGAGPSTADVVLLHVSDLHSNPVGIQLVEETADRFEVDAIIDTGDLTSFGTSLEQAVVMRISRIDVPYHVVPGNHDHPDIRQAFADAGVSVLDPGVVEIEGIEILGVGDPTFTADNRLSKARRYSALEGAAREVADLVARHRPDVVAVHNEQLLERAFGDFAVGLSGHRHEPDFGYIDGSAWVSAGSAGATGLGALAEDEDLPYQMQLLQFEDGRLVAVDRLEFDGTAGAFGLERILVDPDRVAAYPDREIVPLESGPFESLFRLGEVPRR